MLTQPEPMTTLDEDEWRAYKRATRALKYRQRMEGEPHKMSQFAEPAAWLAAVERDTDPAERELVLEEQAA